MTENTRHETPDVAELRRLYEAAMCVGANEMAWDEWTTAISEAADALLDAAAERDALAAKVERVRALHRAVGIYDECDCDAPDPARPGETVAEAVPERVSLPEDYREAIGQAIGAASMCWTPRPSDAVFDSERASAIADELVVRFAHMTEARNNARAEVERLTAQVERVRALADEWTYNGEFGWDDGSHAYGPDCEGQALDYAAAKLRRALDEEPQS